MTRENGGSPQREADSPVNGAQSHSPRGRPSKSRSPSARQESPARGLTPPKKERKTPPSPAAPGKESLEDIEMSEERQSDAAMLGLREEPTATGTPSAGLKTDLDELGGGNFTPSADDLAFEQELQKSLALDGLSESNTIGPESKSADPSGRSASAAVKPPKGADGDGDNDNDSLFGGGSEEGGDVDADGEEDDEDDADAEGEQDDDDDDQPLSSLAKGLDGDGSGNDATSGNAGAGINLPGLGGNDFSSTSALPLPKAGSSKATSTTSKSGKNGADTTSKKTLKTPAWGGLTTTEGYDADTTQFSNDLLLTTTLGGQAILWDRRVPASEAGGGGAGSSGGIRALPLPANTPPWCASAAWAPDGERIYLGRRNESVEEWDMRMLSSRTGSGVDGASSDALGSTWRGKRGNMGLVRTFRFPSGSGPVTSLAVMPNGRHLVW